MKRTLVIGRVTRDRWRDADAVSPADERGGPGANVAVELARQGHAVTLATCFGTDFFSAAYRTYLHDLGISTEGSITMPGALPTVSVWRHEPDRYEIENDPGYQNLGGIEVAADKLFDVLVLTDIPIDTAPRLASTSAVYVMPHYPLVIGLTSMESILHRKPAAIVLNAAESRCAVHGSRALQQIASTHGATIFVTRGASPTLIYRPGKRRASVRVRRPSRLISTLGAGDAFGAAVIDALERGRSACVAAREGHRSARRVLHTLGAQAPRCPTC